MYVYSSLLVPATTSAPDSLCHRRDQGITLVSLRLKNVSDHNHSEVILTTTRHAKWCQMYSQWYYLLVKY